MWGCKFRVVIIPTLLAFAFLGTWLASGDSVYSSLNQFETPRWAYLTGPTSLALSLTVNALVTGLIVFRIFKVFQEVRATSDDQILGATAWLVLNIVGTDTASRAFDVIGPIYDMLIGITPTIILVRTSMGLSFHDEKSMEEVAIGSLRFASNNPNSVPEMGSIDIVLGQDSRDDGVIEVQRSNDIEVVDR